MILSNHPDSTVFQLVSIYLSIHLSIYLSFPPSSFLVETTSRSFGLFVCMNEKDVFDRILASPLYLDKFQDLLNDQIKDDEDGVPRYE